MTTINQTDKKCGVCATQSVQFTVGSSYTMGAPDLDMRPAPLARWTLEFEMQECPECGYCAADISRAGRVAKEMVGSEAYHLELKRTDYPALTRRYLCASLILAAKRDWAGAGSAALGAAWAADDEAHVQAHPVAEPAGMELDELEPPSDYPPGMELGGAELEDEIASFDEARLAAIAAAKEAAARCRRLAIQHFEADRKRELTFAADEGTAELILADLYRRVGEFEGARIHAEAGIEGGAEGLLLDVLTFEIQLADFFDSDCHNIEEAGMGELGLLF